jgi:phage terminase small subunit
MLEQPHFFENGSIEAEVWQELNEAYAFTIADKENLILLCHWKAVARHLMTLTKNKQGKFQLVGANADGSVSLNPSFEPLREAREEIERLEKQLRIEPTTQQKKVEREQTPLEIIQNRRRKKCNVARACGE